MISSYCSMEMRSSHTDDVNDDLVKFYEVPTYTIHLLLFYRKRLYFIPIVKQREKPDNDFMHCSHKFSTTFKSVETQDETCPKVIIFTSILCIFFFFLFLSKFILFVSSRINNSRS